MEPVELSHFLIRLKENLAEARRHAMPEGEEIRFAFDEIELELSVVATKDGGVKLGVMTIGGEANIATSSTQKITLRMNPTDKGGNSSLISGERTR